MAHRASHGYSRTGKFNCGQCGCAARFEIFVDQGHALFLCDLHTREYARKHRDGRTLDADEMGRPIGYPRYYEIKPPEALSAGRRSTPDNLTTRR